MPTTADRLNEYGSQPLRPPKMTHHSLELRIVAYQETPLTRNATMVTLLLGPVLRFPPYAEASGKGVHPTPFRKEKQHPQTPPRRSEDRHGFLPNAKKPLPRKLHGLPPIDAAHQHANTVMTPPPSSHCEPMRGLEDETREQPVPGRQRCSRVEGTTSTTFAVADRTL